MLSFKSLNYYNEMRKIIDKFENIMKFIYENLPKDEEKAILKSIFTSTYSLNSTQVYYAIKKENGKDEFLILNYMNKFKKFRIEFEFLELSYLISEANINFSEISNEYKYNDFNIYNLIKDIKKLASLYQDVLRSDDLKEKMILFFDYAEQVYLEYATIKNCIASFNDSLVDNNEISKDGSTEELEIQLLNVKYNVGEFANILSLLNDAYCSMITLYKKAKVTNLEIIKIESGSLLSKILGDKSIIGFIGKSLNMIADTTYKRFTTTGKIMTHKEMIEAISSDADLIKKLEEMGIDTKTHKQELGAVLNVVINNLYKIVEKAPRIMIDGNDYSAVDETKYIAYSTEMIEKPKDESEEGKEPIGV
jgi:hypothetical protein